MKRCNLGEPKELTEVRRLRGGPSTRLNKTLQTFSFFLFFSDSGPLFSRTADFAKFGSVQPLRHFIKHKPPSHSHDPEGMEC